MPDSEQVPLPEIPVPVVQEENASKPLSIVTFSKKYIFNRFVISELMLVVTVIGMIFGWTSAGNPGSLPSIFFFLSMMLTFMFQLFLLQILFRVTSSPEKLMEQLAVSNFRAERERAKVNTIVSSIGDAVFAVDRKGKLILMNSVAQVLSGHTFQEAEGQYYGDIFHFFTEENADLPYPNYVESVMETGEPSELVEHTILSRRDGKRFAISDSCAPIHDEKGKVWGCVVVFRDATKERDLEKTRNNFFSIASHQLRTPLGSMRWNLEMLRAGEYGKLPQEVVHVVEDIHESTGRLIDLVNNLLDVSRMDNQTTGKKLEELNPAEEIDSVIKEMKAAAQKRTIKLVFEKGENIPNVLADKNLFHQVMDNLLSNAIKYSFPGYPVKVMISYDAPNIHIQVADRGIGVPEKDQSRLFSRFFRAENAQLSEADGSGLGLYVVKSYVESWKGKVWTESPTYTETLPTGEIKKGGSTFHVLLPSAVK